MILFGSRGWTVALYALAVMLVIGMGYVLFRMMFAGGISRSAVILWLGITAAVMIGEFLYSELDFWKYHNGMAGVWMYLGMPVSAGLLWLLTVFVTGRRR